MTEDGAVRTAGAILAEFARRTGLAGDAPPRRYLWTDAFAVCTWLGLDRRGVPGALPAALRLVDQVHEVLGRHRADDPRTGWLSGLDEAEGRRHPTVRGLRIGKRLPERGPDEPFDERLEWDRDGQYFHYLTKWMHALALVARATGDELRLRQAIELARAAHAGFTYVAGGEKRMVWKASVDLTRPLVPSMGAHDPLDGLITLRALRADALRAGWSRADVGLDGAVGDLSAMCTATRWATADPLGIGGLLGDAWRLTRLARDDDPDAQLANQFPRQLLGQLLDGAAAGLAAFASGGTLRADASERLAFRELGLAIGLHAVEALARLAPPPDVARRVDTLRAFLPLAGAIERFWLEPAHQRAPSWREHVDINAVMLATSLVPEGYLDDAPNPET